MAPKTPVAECIDAFMRRNYEKCAARSADLLAASIDAKAALEFDVLLLNLISLERLGQFKQAVEHAAVYYSRLADSFQQQLMALAIARGEPAKLLDFVGEKRDKAAAENMWQIYLCFGAQYVSRHRWSEARGVFQNVLTGNLTPVSCMAMVLCAVEYNYIVHGSALSEFDKPIVELNGKTAETTDLNAALVFARRAHEEGQRELGKQHPAYLTAVFNLAAVYMKLGRFAEAEPYLNETVALRRTACGPDDDNVVEALNLLGALYKRLGNNQRAGECYGEALDITERKSAGSSATADS